MTDFLRLFRALDAGGDACAVSAGSASSPPIGTIGPIGTGMGTPPKPVGEVAQPSGTVTTETHFVPRWIDDNHMSTDSDCCALCGKGETTGAAVVPFGGTTAGHVWLHPECWSEWMEGRQAEARAAYSRWCATAEAGLGAP